MIFHWGGYLLQPDIMHDALNVDSFLYMELSDICWNGKCHSFFLVSHCDLKLKTITSIYQNRNDMFFFENNYLE